MLTQSPAERVDCVVIGAGVVGLAVARALGLAGREVIVLEAEGAIGSGVSSRNSEVIHAGMYYPAGSLRARLCASGNRMLRDYAASRGVSHQMTGKLIVATDAAEAAQLDSILEKGRVNGVEGLVRITAAQAREMEPDLHCVAALLSPATGIIDTHGLMLSLLGEVEAAGGALALKSPVIGGKVTEEGMRLDVGGPEPMALLARNVVLAAGLSSPRLGAALGLAHVPPAYLCKGNYFTLSGRTPFKRLVYPVPVAAGLGVHFTLDLGGRGRFGPDVEWVNAEDYRVDPRRGDSFYAAIRRYWPGLAEGALEPAYAGIRPKITAEGEAAADFLIHGPAQTGVPGVAALYGIESPGLTSCLAIARYVGELLA
ncbi:Aminobutyraldehyde dehydrogenase [Paramagnetospirillum magnetotacticum MS-1]|uniref:Aminobutyraldehyde dehydrogenase n=1 Tax=Paramagnetospirillum magnetotacticum MS-1 TaxID=272627 RepID=A0A0C2YQ10_PARME|nr:NAD(P)/FAD-dependent oxidoreductase [Paramagnetospirillum magnetotacticum]KIL97203.1 Aminobutyraldehyde dehydrogenase [Paramagnetospirillum magnetotacticum MS-1]